MSTTEARGRYESEAEGDGKEKKPRDLFQTQTGKKIRGSSLGPRNTSRRRRRGRKRKAQIKPSPPTLRFTERGRAWPDKLAEGEGHECEQKQLHRKKMRVPLLHFS